MYLLAGHGVACVVLRIFVCSCLFVAAVLVRVVVSVALFVSVVCGVVRPGVSAWCGRVVCGCALCAYGSCVCLR